MNSAIIEVIIGLVLVYALLSLLVSQINNIITGLLGLRARFLRGKLQDLLSDPRIQQQVLTHPLVNVQTPKGKGTDTTYVAPATLARVMIEVLTAGKRLDDLADLRSGIKGTSLEPILKPLLDPAQKIEDAQQKIEAWFDLRLNQLSELFKRRMSLISFVIGMLLAIFMNVDSLVVGQALWDDPVLRDTVSQAAETAVRQVQVQAGRTTTGEEELAAATEQAQETVRQLLDLRLPIGWEYTPLSSAEAEVLPNRRLYTCNLWNGLPTNNVNWLSFWAERLIGWIITAVAVMQGAPFWFDLMRQLTQRGKA